MPSASNPCPLITPPPSESKFHNYTVLKGTLHICTYMCIYIYVYIHICMYADIYIYIYMYTCSFLHIEGSILKVGHEKQPPEERLIRLNAQKPRANKGSCYGTGSYPKDLGIPPQHGTVLVGDV